MRRSLALVVLVAAALAGSAHGQTATLVRDIDSSSPWSGTAPANDLLGLADKVLAFGDEPAVAEGSGASSELLADLCPGSLASTPHWGGRLGNLAFFSAFPTGDPQTAWLYRSDGTRTGTYALGPITNNFVVALDHVFFLNRHQLWVSDGSVAGTRQVPLPDKPIQDMTAAGRRVFLVLGQNDLWVSDGSDAGTFLLHPFALTEALGLGAGGVSRLYFLVSAGGGALALWTSDGTPGGTRQVPGFPLAHGFVPPLKTLGDQAYLAVDDQVHGQELWTSDGTAQGSHRVSDLADPAPFGTEFGLPAPPVAAFSGRLFFATRGGLFSSTGTPGSTTLLAPVTRIFDSSFVQVGPRLLFLGAVPDGREVWVTDGNPTGTRRLARACTGQCFAAPTELVAPQGAAFFPVTDAQGTALWTSDGTTAGTRPYTSTLPQLVLVRHFAAVGRQIFFDAGDTGPTITLWTSDGRPGGTHPVPGVATTGASSRPQDVVTGGGHLFFTACDGTSRQVWKSDGTEGGTVPLTSLAGTACSEDLFNLPEPRAVTPAGNLAFFWAPEEEQWHLWRTDDDGNALDLAPVSVFLPVGTLPPLVPFAGKVYFSIGGSVFRSDGTREGTVAATELALPSPSDLGGTAGGLLFFLSSGVAAEPSSVWASDGTAAGTRRLLTGSFSSLQSPVQAGAWIYFFTAGTDIEIWRTDGTAAGTSQVGTLGTSLNFFFSIPATAVLGDAIYFLGNFSLGNGLYRIDPTGVTLLKPLGAQENFSFPVPHRLAVFAGRLFFVATDDSHGPALWSTDGTAAETVLVRAIGSGVEPLQIAWLTAAGGRLFFTAWDTVHGTELWESDGTATGTRLAADIAPEGASSSPQALTVAGDRLFFTADDGVAGREVWSLPLSGPAGCQPSDTRLCLAGNRFQVEIAWKDFQGHLGVGHAVPLTADTGYFWFFDPANVETVVKVLDARALNQAFWVFYGALSSVEYEITVTDTQTGLSRRYGNPSGQLASVGDTHGFGLLGAFDTKVAESPQGLPLVSARTEARAATATCVPTPGKLCLQGDRFAVTAAWKDFAGHTGTAVALTADTGYFWFFSPTNVEVVAKVLDGRGLNGKFWLFYGALSNVEYTLTVTDTQTGAVKTYKNPSGQFGSVADTGAF